MREFDNADLNEKLDIVLTYMNDNPQFISPLQLASLISSKPSQSSDEIERMMFFLYGRKHYLEYSNSITFKITFKGQYFVKNSGFVKSKEQREKRAKWQDTLALNAEKNANRLNTLTFWLATGTGALFILELIKFLLEHHLL